MSKCLLFLNICFLNSLSCHMFMLRSNITIAR